MNLDQSKVPVLEINDLSVAYKIRGGEILAVRNISYNINPGEVFAVVGESGCGKSTVAWAVTNFLGNNGYVKNGSIKLEGRELVNLEKKELNKLRGNKFSMVYQDPMQSLNPSLKIGLQMREVLKYHSNMSPKKIEDRCLDMLNRVHMPDPRNVMRRYPHQISGGQQQRVIIAMSLLTNPTLLIMDEPTTALDVTVEAAVLDLIQELCVEFNTSIMFITHNLGVVARIASKVGVMYAGELVEEGSVQNVFELPRHPYTQGLMRCVPKLGSSKTSSVLHPIQGRVPHPSKRSKACVFNPRCDYKTELCETKRPILSDAGNGTRVRCHLKDNIGVTALKAEQISVPSGKTDSLSDSPVILEVEELKTYYPKAKSGKLKEFFSREKKYVKALEKASFKVEKGKTLGIVGESGCGKSTLLKTIIGLEKASNGKIRFFDQDVTARIEKRNVELVREMQMVFQNPDSTLNPAYSVGSQIARPMLRFNKVPVFQVREETIKLLKLMRLGAGYYDRLPNQLSGGEKQRVGIARALASQPALLLCDEPVSALDVSVQAAIINLLIDIQEELNTTLVFISHDLSVVRFFADTICVMYLGNIMEVGSTEEICQPPFHPYTEALLSAVPIPDPKIKQRQIRLEGTIPSAVNPPKGCSFNTRCPRRMMLADPDVCLTPPPVQKQGNHSICCHLSWEQLTAMSSDSIARVAS